MGEQNIREVRYRDGSAEIDSTRILGGGKDGIYANTDEEDRHEI